MFSCCQKGAAVVEDVEASSAETTMEQSDARRPSPTLLGGGAKPAGAEGKAHEAAAPVPYAHSWAEAVEKYSSMDTLVFDGNGLEHHFTYRDLEASANRLARNLSSMGLKVGDRLITVTENRPEMVALILASVKLGHTFVPLATDLRVQDCHTMVQLYEPGLIVFDQPKYAPFASAGVGLYRSILLPSYEDEGNELKRMMAEGSLDSVEFARVPPGVPSFIFSTSGATGVPKGVMYSAEHLRGLTSWGGNVFNVLDSKTKNILKVKQALSSSAFGNGVLQSLGLRTKHLLWVSMRGVSGTMLLLKQLLEGTLNVMVDTYPSGPQLWAKMIEKHSINSHVLFGAGMHQMLQEMPDRTFRSIKSIAYSGSCFAPTLIQKSMAQFPNAFFIQVYGMTEVNPISLLGPQHHKKFADASAEDVLRMASAGKPLNPDDVFIEDMDQPGSGKPPPPEKNGVGQVCAHSTVTMMAYYGSPEKTREAIPDGKFVRTGDIGRFDQDGFLHVLGRVKDIIPAYKGFNVAPRDIEEVLHTHPGVGQASVCGIWHPSGAGEAVVAWVVAKSGQQLDAGDLRRHCQESGLPAWQMPDAIHVSERALPMVSGKTDGKELRATAWRQAALVEALDRAAARGGEAPGEAARHAEFEALAAELSEEEPQGALSEKKLEATFGEALPQAKVALRGMRRANLLAVLQAMTQEERESFALFARSLLVAWAAETVA